MSDMGSGDFLEDLLAFLYATGGKKTPQPSGVSTCSLCGAALEEGDDGELHCPDCGE